MALKHEWIVCVIYPSTKDDHANAVCDYVYFNHQARNEACFHASLGAAQNRCNIIARLLATAECFDERSARVATTIVDLGTQSGFNPTYEFFAIG